MTAPAYELNGKEAREGTGGSSGRINTTGAYTGKFTKAKHIEASTGTVGVEFEFESNSGENARFTLYTKNSSGELIYGGKQLQALMAVMRVKGLTPKLTTIEEYDFNTKSMITGPAEVYSDLQNKPVGIVLQMEEYLNSSDEIKSRPNFFAPFDANSKQTAAEVLDQKPAANLEKMLATLKDKTLPAQQNQTAANAYQAPHASSAPPPEGTYDDDIPF